MLVDVLVEVEVLVDVAFAPWGRSTIHLPQLFLHVIRWLSHGFEEV